MSLLAIFSSVHNNVVRGTRQNPANGVETVVNTYMVRLADLDTHEEQRILVRSACEDGMQEFVDSIKDHPSWPQLTLATPRVVPGGIRKLEIRHRAPRTTLASFCA